MVGDARVAECPYAITWWRQMFRHEGKNKLDLLAGSGVAISVWGMW